MWKSESKFWGQVFTFDWVLWPNSGRRLAWQVSGQALLTAELAQWPNCSSALHTNDISLIIWQFQMIFLFKSRTRTMAGSTGMLLHSQVKQSQVQGSRVKCADCPARTPVSHSHQHGSSSQSQLWRTHLAGNQQLSSWTEALLDKRKSCPGIET